MKLAEEALNLQQLGLLVSIVAPHTVDSVHLELLSGFVVPAPVPTVGGQRGGPLADLMPNFANTSLVGEVAEGFRNENLVVGLDLEGVLGLPPLLLQLPFLDLESNYVVLDAAHQGSVVEMPFAEEFPKDVELKQKR